GPHDERAGHRRGDRPPEPRARGAHRHRRVRRGSGPRLPPVARGAERRRVGGLPRADGAGAFREGAGARRRRQGRMTAPVPTGCVGVTTSFTFSPSLAKPPSVMVYSPTRSSGTAVTVAPPSGSDCVLAEMSTAPPVGGRNDTVSGPVNFFGVTEKSSSPPGSARIPTDASFEPATGFSVFFCLRAAGGSLSPVSTS